VGKEIQTLIGTLLHGPNKHVFGACVHASPPARELTRGGALPDTGGESPCRRDAHRGAGWLFGEDYPPGHPCTPINNGEQAKAVFLPRRGSLAAAKIATRHPGFVAPSHAPNPCRGEMALCAGPSCSNGTARRPRVAKGPRTSFQPGSSCCARAAPPPTSPSLLALRAALSAHSPANSGVQNLHALPAPRLFPTAEIGRKRL
jgi:hypothetical protein